MVQVSLDGRLLIIERRNGTTFIGELAMMLIDHLDRTWTINNNRQGFKATFVRIFGGNKLFSI